MTDGSFVRYHGRDDTPSVLMNLIRSQCVVVRIKRLKVLTTCCEIWYAVSLVTNRPEEWTYLPPLVFASSGYLIRRVGICVARATRSTDM
jgi:hypothetical protein